MEAVQMTKAIETNKIVVVKVSELGCTCAVNGSNKEITWTALTDAARQQDADLASVYSAVRAEARKMVEGNRALPIRCSVGQNETNVWWVASFSDVAGEWSWIPRDADEGGTLAHEWMAAKEAKARAARLRKLGYTVLGC
jgi:hypothetical protein